MLTRIIKYTGSNKLQERYRNIDW